jgi:hypothetical protein
MEGPFPKGAALLFSDGVAANRRSLPEGDKPEQTPERIRCLA